MFKPGGPSRQTWIDLCQKAWADPHDLVTKNLDKLFELIHAASVATSRVSDIPTGLFSANEDVPTACFAGAS